VRELRVLEDCRLSVLAERRRHAPPGRSGGEDGAPGRTLVNGEEQPPKLTRQLHAGDVVRVETPGGGGHGTPE
jgi:N-methylhydantoinase B